MFPVDRDSLRAEYAAAQGSAEHHDGLVWTVTSIFWGASLVLLGFILDNAAEVELRSLTTALASFGLLLTVFVWTLALSFNSIVRQKYQRCKEIEGTLHMRHHTALRYQAGFQRIIYGVIMVGFIVVWTLVLCTVWRN